ncbi:Hypothetical_protein [Hexamita inflata]|uniref:Hypothetical_protein n=1 Tax=Hexamita inflata TaxID=28002 RepID=A0AA86U553_9EUKA|nr:Hypothetical protein HINF_LOCUS18453 [Hexamita inflata]
MIRKFTYSKLPQCLKQIPSQAQLLKTPSVNNNSNHNNTEDFRLIPSFQPLNVLIREQTFELQQLIKRVQKIQNGTELILNNIEILRENGRNVSLYLQKLYRIQF